MTGSSMLAVLELDEIAAFVFIDIAVIVVVARLMGALFKKLRQPAVVGEIIAGIALGPTLLGALPGNLPNHLFPTEVRPFLSILAQLGLVIFMFIVGMEIDMSLIRGNERVAAVISLCSIVLPFASGFALAAVLHGSHDVVQGKEVDYLPFALFIGASMSVTAFPVLARILTERGMYRTAVGTLAVACAAVDDIIAWSLLAVVVAVVESSSAWDLPRILLLSVLFVATMFTVVKPKLVLLADRYRAVGRLTPGILSVILVGMLTSAFITSKIGIHSIFGAFLFGAIMPRVDTTALFHEILERLEQVSVLLLLPVFFIATGLGVDVGGIGGSGLVELALILTVACLGKFVGAAAGARMQGVPTPKAAAIGILMNTRGLTELVILNIGLSKGVLDAELFTMLVVMAVFTTVITEPLLRLVYPDKLLARDIAEAERAALGIPDAYRVLVLVDDPEKGEGLLDVALCLASVQTPSEVVLTRFRPFPSTGVEVGSGLVAELAEMAGSLAEINQLADRARQRGASCVVLSHFSEDPGRDVVTQAATVEADVLIIGAGEALPARVVGTVLKDAGCQVVVVTPGRRLRVTEALPSHPVVAAAGGGADAETSLEVAARIALALGTEIRLVGASDGRRAGHRTATTLSQLQKMGIACAMVPVAPDGLAAELARQSATAAVVIRPAAGASMTGVYFHETGSRSDEGPSAPVLVVRAGIDHDSSDLGRVLEKIKRNAHEGPGESNSTASGGSSQAGDQQVGP